MSHYLDLLNEPQREAVLHTDGPTMLIAGAGSGKTRVLTYRVAHLLEKGVDAFHILSLTFTNKAAQEMRNRIASVVGSEAKNLWMGTFHSVFARILRAEAEAIGYPRDFTIYDTDDSKSLIKSILKEMNLDDKTYKPSAVYSRISMAKNNLISHAAYQSNPVFKEEDYLAQRPQLGDIYKKYVERCRKAGAMDFDDLLFNTNLLFRDHPDILFRYQEKFRYIMVDEYQDTNMSQYLITKRLAEGHKNICVVGDDAQSIYAFRGANIMNILNFEKDYPNLKTIKLEQNYRSTNIIVQAANSIIKHNQNQLRKDVWTSNEEGTLVDVLKTHTDSEEGRLVATTIFEEKMKEGWKNGDFAVLYRTNAQSRAIEEALRRMNIKYRIIGGLSFYQRKEIKDMIAYLRLIVNPNDEEAFKRIINYPKRGIGDASQQKIIITASEQGADLWDVVRQSSLILTPRAAAPLENFTLLIRSFQVLAQEQDAFSVANRVGRDTGLMRELHEDKTPEGVSRYENVQELLNAMKEFVDNPEREDKSIGAFLQEVSLLTDADDAKKQDGDSVTLMTIHGSKGLEFKSVFIVGMEEELFPSAMMMNSREDLEEERRLFYVAATRAEKRLRLSFAESRYRFGTLRSCAPSRFLKEVDAKFLTVSNKFSAEDKPAGLPGASFASQFTTSAKPVAKIPAAKVHVASADFKPTPPSLIQVGNRVEHPKFGYGVVLSMETQNQGDTRAEVDFQNHGLKTLLLSFAKLMVVPNQ